MLLPEGQPHGQRSPQRKRRREREKEREKEREGDDHVHFNNSKIKIGTYSNVGGYILHIYYMLSTSAARLLIMMAVTLLLQE